MDANITEASPAATLIPIQELIQSLEQATLLIKQLPSAADPAHLLQIQAALHQAHLHLSVFLSSSSAITPHHLLPLPPPPPLPPSTTAAENSFSSATGVADNGGEPMQVGEEDEAEDDSKNNIDRVEERMRNCFIKNKRPKRPLSPSAAAEEGRLHDDEDGGGSWGFDPHGAKLRALDLVYQFHG